MYHEMPNHELPVIDVIDNRGGVPYLQIIWHLSLRSALERYLKKHNVVIGGELWTH